MSNEDKAFLDDLKLEILGGEQRVKFSLYSISQIKRLTGVSLMKPGEIDFGNPELLVGLVWGAIIEEQPKFDGVILGATPEKKIQEILRQIGRELVGEKIHRAAEVMGEALARCFVMPSKEGSETSEGELKN